MEITKQESISLRGIAITIIVLHNLVHIALRISCNEFYFCQDYAQRVFDEIQNSPYSIAISYWGWLGVPLFVFVSGYGLSMKSISNIENKIEVHGSLLRCIIRDLQKLLLGCPMCLTTAGSTPFLRVLHY